MAINGNLKTKKMITENTTIREFLQALGTECLRDNLSKNIWTAALFADYKANVKEWDDLGNDKLVEYPSWCITDMRFPNEMKAVAAKGGITIRVIRDNGTRAIDTNPHASETALDDCEFDYHIDNSGTIEDLIEKVREILVNEKLL